MIQAFQSNDSYEYHECPFGTSGSLVVMSQPTPDEVKLVCERYVIPNQMFGPALDRHELPRIYERDGKLLIVLDTALRETMQIPMRGKRVVQSVIRKTYPLGIILVEDAIILVSIADLSYIIALLRTNDYKARTHNVPDMVLDIASVVVDGYIESLERMNEDSNILETKLHTSMRNNELIELLALNKSLIYFTASLKANNAVFRKLLGLRQGFFKKLVDGDALEDIVIQNEQAMEMAEIRTQVMANSSDVLTAIIANNQNLAMKMLAAVATVLAVPTIIGGFFGMNVTGIPMNQHPMGFWFIVGISVVLCAVVLTFLRKKNML